MSLVEQALHRMRESLGVARPAAGDAVPASRRPSGAYSQERVVLDEAALRDQGLLPPPERQRQLMRECRQIKQKLLDEALGRRGPPVPNGRVILVTSALPGEGKTFLSFNLARSMAQEKDVRVILIDSDCHKLNLTEALGLKEKPGLLDAMRDAQTGPTSLVVPTSLGDLHFIPAGVGSENSTELLSSARAHEVFQALLQSDPGVILIIDSPPLLLTTESQALAQLAGQVVVVVRSDQTPQRAVTDAIESMGKHAGIAMVLNQCVGSIFGGRSYYPDYGSKYGNPAE